jgi:hypothetical protein
MSIPPPELTFHPNNREIAVLDGAVQILNANEDIFFREAQGGEGVTAVMIVMVTDQIH